MQKGTWFSFLLLLILNVVLLVPAQAADKTTGRVQVSTSSQSSSVKKTGHVQASPNSELTRILADLEDVVMRLQYENSLSAEEVSSLRSELALIYRDLKALNDRLDSTGNGNDQADEHEGWLDYPDARRELSPYGARFNGWNPSADVSFEFGRHGEILLNIDNVDYKVTWTIPVAYQGEVEARVNSTSDGTIVLTVRDANGKHEFQVSDGGLGTMRHRTTYQSQMEGRSAH
jgi:hypothetical protein